MSQNPNVPGQAPGQWPAQQGVPQQGVPQQGVPQQGVPQQGVPQQGVPQQGVPQQGAPQYPQQAAGQYPQQGAPQYPQQGAPQYPQQAAGQYPQQGAPQYPQQQYAQQQQYARPGYGPQAGYPQGGGQPPGGRASSNKVLMIVIGAVLLLVLAGAVLLMLSNRSTPNDPVDPKPTVPTATASASTEPTATTEPTDTPTTEPTDNPTENPTTPGGVIDLGSGVMFQVADGWEIQEQAPNAISVSDGNAVLVTRVVQQKKNTNAGQLCDAFNRQILGDTAGAKFGDPKDVGVDLKNLTISQCPAAYVSTSNGKSTQMLVVTFAAVRTTDGVATLSTMLFTNDTPDSSFSAIDTMLGVVLGTQSAG